MQNILAGEEEDQDQEKTWIAEINGSELRDQGCENTACALNFTDIPRECRSKCIRIIDSN